VSRDGDPQVGGAIVKTIPIAAAARPAKVPLEVGATRGSASTPAATSRCQSR
jgi:hypothetical protein